MLVVQKDVYSSFEHFLAHRLVAAAAATQVRLTREDVYGLIGAARGYAMP